MNVLKRKNQVIIKVQRELVIFVFVPLRKAAVLFRLILFLRHLDISLSTQVIFIRFLFCTSTVEYLTLRLAEAHISPPHIQRWAPEHSPFFLAPLSLREQARFLGHTNVWAHWSAKLRSSAVVGTGISEGLSRTDTRIWVHWSAKFRFSISLSTAGVICGQPQPSPCDPQDLSWSQPQPSPLS